MAEPALKQMSYPEYLELELETLQKHEWLDGEAVAMSGGSIVHARLIRNVVTKLGDVLRGGSCEVFTSELKVRVEATGLATYPDASVFCEPLETHPDDRNAATNPTLLVEVLSPSTERWDRGDKFEHYRQLPSLRDYLLVSQVAQRVEHYQRNDDGSWTLKSLGPGEAVKPAAGAWTLAVDEVFDGVTLERPESPFAR